MKMPSQWISYCSEVNVGVGISYRITPRICTSGIEKPTQQEPIQQFGSTSTRAPDALNLTRALSAAPTAGAAGVDAESTRVVLELTSSSACHSLIRPDRSVGSAQAAFVAHRIVQAVPQEGKCREKSVRTRQSRCGSVVAVLG